MGLLRIAYRRRASTCASQLRQVRNGAAEKPTGGKPQAGQAQQQQLAACPTVQVAVEAIACV